MGFLDTFKNLVRGPRADALHKQFSTITEYAPAFSTWSGGMYEKALVRSSIEKCAVFASKLKPEVLGTAKPRVRRLVNTAPNQYMSWPKMIGRLMTILMNDTTAAVVPALNDNLDVVGLFPLKFESADVVEYAGEAWIKFYLGSGETMAIELEKVCILTRFQYESDFFGGGNGAITPVLQLMDFQDQAQENAIKNAANIRFIAAANGTMRPEDIDKKRDEFSERNLSAKNKSGLMVYDNTFESVHQIEPYSYTISDSEMARIEANVYNYFGINGDILRSDYSEEQFGAFYEGVVEPFAVQLGEGLTQMLFTQRERTAGNRVLFSANRLEYASNASKRNMIRDMLDRRIMTINEGREILQLPPVPGGDVFIERGEYVSFDKDGNVLTQTGGRLVGPDGIIEQPGSTLGDNDSDPGGDDDEYKDNDTRGEKEVDW